jgi:hypothetical protein
MRELLTGWNRMRIIRLVLGVIVIVQGVNHREALYIVLGGMLVLMALANAGCGAGGCAVGTGSAKGSKEKETVYEEVDTTK